MMSANANVLQELRFFHFACHSALRLVGREQEPSQAIDMAFRHSNLRRHVLLRLHEARDPSSEEWNYGRKYCPVNLTEMTTSTPFWDLLHAEKYGMGTTALLPL